ncbi:MAG: hypothetical protein ACXV7J_02815 [Methylomonas sp.]
MPNAYKQAPHQVVGLARYPGMRKLRLGQDTAGDGFHRERRSMANQAFSCLSGKTPRSCAQNVAIEQGEIEKIGKYDLEGLFVRMGVVIDALGVKPVAFNIPRPPIHCPTQRQHPAADSLMRGASISASEGASAVKRGSRR